VKNRTPVMNRRRRPSRSAARPPSQSSPPRFGYVGCRRPRRRRRCQNAAAWCTTAAHGRGTSGRRSLSRSCSIAFGLHSPTRRSRRWCRRRSRRRSARIRVSGGRCSVWPLVGLSRIYLGVHYVLDVLEGAALGLELGLLMVWATRRLLGWLGRSGMSLRGDGTASLRAVDRRDRRHSAVLSVRCVSTRAPRTPSASRAAWSALRERFSPLALPLATRTRWRPVDCGFCALPGAPRATSAGIALRPARCRRWPLSAKLVDPLVRMARLCLPAEPARIGGDPKLVPKVLSRPEGRPCRAVRGSQEGRVELCAGVRRAMSSCARELIPSLR
jgi:PAP2 superfamily